MGPPKKKQYRIPYQEHKRRENYFEYRWHSVEGHYYFFNPYTGETIMNAELETLDRNASLWGRPEKETEISKDAYGLLLLQPVYASRTWGIRRFAPYNGDRARAGYHIFTVVIAHMTRLALKKYFQTRYYTILCPFSQYYYFFDTWNPKADTSWQKPYLAGPGAITPYVPFDPTDNMPRPEDKYLLKGFIKGPYHRQSRIGKGNTERTEQDAFYAKDDRRAIALRTNADIDLEKYPLGSLVLWMDDMVLQTLTITDYVAVRSSINGGNWARTLDFMEENWKRPLTRIYCWHSFAKTDVPLDGKYLTADGQRALNLSRECLEDERREFKTTEKVFMAQALASLLSERACRLEYFNADYVDATGEARAKAVEDFIAKRAGAFNKYMRRIPTEEVRTTVKGSKDFVIENHPAGIHQSLIEGVLLVLSLLAHDSEHKEPIAANVCESVFYALRVCRENPTLTLCGLRLLYNLCQRCESGQEHIHKQNVVGLLRDAKMYHSADPQVAQMTRRLELALKQNGWRGNVEMLMEREMRGEALHKRYLKKAYFERPYPEDFKSALEIAEEERLAAIAIEKAEQAAIDKENEEEEEARAKSRNPGDSPLAGSPADAKVSDWGGRSGDVDDKADRELPNDESGDILGALDSLRSSLGELRGSYRRAEAKDAPGETVGDTSERKVSSEGKEESKGRDYKGGDDDDNHSVNSELTHLTHDDVGR